MPTPAFPPPKLSNSSPLDWSRGSSRRGKPPSHQSSLDWSRGSSRRSAGSGSAGSGGKGGLIRFKKGISFNFDDGTGNNDPSSHHSVRPASPQVKRYIKKMSSLVADPIELSLDQRRLQNAVREAGEYSFGIGAIAVWEFEDGRLVPPIGGWWRSHEMEESEALLRLEDPDRPDAVPPKPVNPGTDIAGILWTESRNTGLRTPFESTASLTSLAKTADPVSSPMRWRDLKSLVIDPDSAKGPRLALMKEAGFTMAAGITFQYAHHQGMVIFLTTVKDRRDEHLTCIANAAYLNQAAQFIGAALSLAELRRASLAARHDLKETCFSMHECECDGCLIVKSASSDPALLVEGGEGGEGAAEDDDDDGPNKESSASFVAPATGTPTTKQQKQDATVSKLSRCKIPSQLKAYLRKLKGGSMQIPPSLSVTQSLWTIFGAFCSLLVLSSLNEYYKILSDDEYYLLIGPFGALMTLQYGLTAAPASQPRNAVLGQAVAGAVSMAFTYIPEYLLPTWLRRAVGPALGIGAMVKLGVTHPPAGAHAVLYASGQYNFVFYALVVLSTLISVIPATLVNNMSSGRQYPTYWSIFPPSLFPEYCCCSSSSNKERKFFWQK